MTNDQKRTRKAKGLPSVPWLTQDGTLDLTKFPIDPLLRQTLDRDYGSYRSGCVLLGSMCVAGRAEAGVYLLGLLQFYQDDLERLAVVVENLGHFPTSESARALANELYRVRSSNSTRRYLASVLRSLSLFPPSLVETRLQKLAEDKSFSFRMRQKFNAVLERCSGNAWGA